MTPNRGVLIQCQSDVANVIGVDALQNLSWSRMSDICGADSVVLFCVLGWHCPVNRCLMMILSVCDIWFSLPVSPVVGDAIVLTPVLAAVHPHWFHYGCCLESS